MLTAVLWTLGWVLSNMIVLPWPPGPACSTKIRVNTPMPDQRQHPPVINPRLAPELRKEQLQSLHIFVGQPEMPDHHAHPVPGCLKHAALAASSTFKGP